MKFKYSLLMGVIFCFLVSFISQDVFAIPAWARKYSYSCTMCHSPNVPRLNEFGHQFRRLGFRLPTEVKQNPDYKEIGQYLAMRGRMRYDYTALKVGRDTTGFRWNDATIFYAGPITQNLSSFFEIESNESNELEPLGQISWLFGNADRYAQIRLGQMHLLSRVGWAGFDRPSGISTNQVLSNTLTTTAVPFTFAKDGRAIELTFGGKWTGRVIAQLINGLNTAGSGTTGTVDNDMAKDISLAYEQILGSKGSGLTAVFYRGVWHNASDSEFKFYRTGITGSWIFTSPLFSNHDGEIQGGTIWSLDQNPKSSDLKDIKAYAFFVDLEHTFKEGSVFGRFDLRNLDSSASNSKPLRQRYTVGIAKQANDNLRLAVEGFGTDDKNTTTNTFGVQTEVMLNF